MIEHWCSQPQFRFEKVGGFVIACNHWVWVRALPTFSADLFPPLCSKSRKLENTCTGDDTALWQARCCIKRHEIETLQIIACSGDVYVVEKHLSKRTWALIWGAVLMIFAFVPSKLQFLQATNCMQILHLDQIRFQVSQFKRQKWLQIWSFYWAVVIEKMR